MANDSRTIGLQPTLSKVSLSVTASSPEAIIGTRRFDAGAEWIYVYNGSSNEEIEKGRGVKLASLSSGYTVDVACSDPATATADMLFGVCVNETIATAYYGWVMTRGVASVMTSQSIAVGGDVFHLVSSGAFMTVTCLTGDSSGATTRMAGVFLADGSDTSTKETVKAYVKSYMV